MRGNGVPSPNGVGAVSWPATISSAPRPRTAVEWVGWMLRMVPGERRKPSEIAPMRDGVVRGSKSGSAARCSIAGPVSE